MAEITQTKNLASAMARIMGDVERIKENGRNTHFNYDYVSDNDVYDAVRVLMAKYSVAVFASMTEPPTQDSKRTVAAFKFTLVHGETGESMECLWWSEAQDTQDKGINKAATAALKYWLLKTFLISSGDPADDADSGVNAPPPAPIAAPPPPAVPKPDVPAASETVADFPDLNGADLISARNLDSLKAWIVQTTGAKNEDHAAQRLLAALTEHAQNVMAENGEPPPTIEALKLTWGDVYGKVDVETAQAAVRDHMAAKV